MTYAVHTDTPLIPLAQMIGDRGHIEVGQAAGGRKDCFYGWGEAMASPMTCKPHHIVLIDEREDVRWLAQTLKMLGHQVVVTAPDVYGDQTGDHHVVDSMPQNYDSHHGH